MKNKKCKAKAMQIKKDHPKEGVILKVFLIISFMESQHCRESDNTKKIGEESLREESRVKKYTKG
jgi:hypothetical protein